MQRLVTARVVFALVLFSAAARAISPEHPGHAPLPSAGDRAWGDDFNITEGTEVFLDGKPGRYEDVPDGAIITYLELAADERTVLRICFRMPKCSGRVLPRNVA